MDDDEFSTTLAELGVSESAPSNEITIKLPWNDDRTNETKNAIVHYPAGSFYHRGFWKNVIFDITKLRDTT